ncbi:unnamed protein product [Owenia fusiformis]|uniref:Uncharacterized protein n=1 Tax=Owenia fusiformis TaxID=6347 RepID=A0A8J1TSJ3_OWEFU|nr:unnamed protein product [Owenia fusiformis]
MITMKDNALLFTVLFGGLFKSGNAELNGTRGTGVITGVEPTIELRNAILLILGFGLFSVLVAITFHLTRKYIFRDASNVDTSFDAGGKVSVGLTATTLVSQMTWSATLLQSVTVAVKYGISGPLWYGAGATVHHFILAILSIHLKTKAPGAKTFLQVIRARFGAPSHMIFCVFAGITNLITTMSLLLAGSAVLTSLTLDLSIELTCMILAAVIGSYTLIGGLGATFYVSYFNSTLIFCFLIVIVTEILLKPSLGIDGLPYGSSDIMYSYIQNATGPDGNHNESYLTILSSGGLMFGVIIFVMSCASQLGDQSYWQSSIAAKPLHGVWGFIAGGLTWFAIPFTFSTTIGLVYIAMENYQGSSILSETDIQTGLAAPVVAQVVLGRTGEYMLFLAILMAVMSTGSAEVIAVASLIVYDVYQPYINPFRKNLKAGDCILCGKSSRPSSDTSSGTSTYYKDRIFASDTNLSNNEGTTTTCSCKPVVECNECAEDKKMRSSKKFTIGVKKPYTCNVHGLYRQYQDDLLNFKNWCILWVTLFTIPLVLFSNWVGLNLGWVFYFTGVMIGGVIIPVALSVLWSRATAAGMISGVLSGCLCGITLWLALASTYEGGVNLKNTSRDVPTLVGSAVSLGLSGIVCIMVSMCTLDRKKFNEEEEWNKLRNIENPLHPWAITYARDFGTVHDLTSKFVRPTYAAMKSRFRRSRITAMIIGLTLFVGFMIVWPCAMIPFKVFTRNEFYHWTTFSIAYAFIAAAFIIIVPLVQEIYLIFGKIMNSRKIRKMNNHVNANYIQDQINN